MADNSSSTSHQVPADHVDRATETRASLVSTSAYTVHRRRVEVHSTLLVAARGGGGMRVRHSRRVGPLTGCMKLAKAHTIIGSPRLARKTARFPSQMEHVLKMLSSRIQT